METDAVISLDGAWIACTGPGMYISRRDGSERRLLAQLDHWLALNVQDTVQCQPAPVSGFVNVETCRFVPLQGLKREIEGW